MENTYPDDFTRTQDLKMKQNKMNKTAVEL